MDYRNYDVRKNLIWYWSNKSFRNIYVLKLEEKPKWKDMD